MRGAWILAAVVLAALGALWLASGPMEGPGEGRLGEDVEGVGRAPVLVGPTTSADPARTRHVAMGPCVIEGSVEDERGRALPEIEVQLERYVEPGPMAIARDDWLEAQDPGETEPYQVVANARTAKDGTFSFRGLAPSVSGYRVRTLAKPPWTSARGHAFLLQGTAFLRFVLTQVTPLRLRVVDAQGHGCGALLSGWYEGGGASGNHASFDRVVTAADGRLTLYVPDGEYECSVRAPGVGSRRGVRIQSPHSREIEIQVGFREGASVAGTVSDTAGQPVAGARILVSCASEVDGWVTRPATSASDGGYQVQGLPAGRISGLAVIAAGFIEVEREAAGRELIAREVTRLDVTLIRGGVLEGTVRGPDGQAIAGASVSATAEHSREGLAGYAHALTNADGFFRMSAVPLGAGHLSAEARGFYPLEGDRNWYLIDGESDSKVVDIQLARCVPVRGRVVDSAGRAVALAGVQASDSVRLGSWSGIEADHNTLTDAEGRFALLNLPPSPHWSLAARTETALSPEQLVDTSTDTAQSAQVELVLRPGAVVQGRIVRDGRAVTDCLSVRVEADVGSMDDMGNVAELRSDGTFILGGLRPGDYHIFVADLDHERISTLVKVALTWGQVERDIVLEMQRLGRVAGVVVAASGAPVPRLSLRLDISTIDLQRSVHARTNQAGEFSFDSVPDNDQLFPIWIGSTRLPGTHKAGEVDLRLVHQPLQSVRLQGTVLLPDGTPTVSGSVMIWEIAPDGGRHGDEVPISNGAFSTLIEPQSSESTFGAEVREVFDVLGNIVSTQPLAIEPVEPDRSIDFRLSVGLEIRGRVFGADGVAVSGARVSLVPKGERLSYRHKNMVSRVDGSFQFGSLAAGAFELHAADVPAPWLPPPALAVQAGDTNARIELHSSGVIRGRVLGPDGKPLASARVTWSRGSGPAPFTLSAQDGSFELSPVPLEVPGTVTALPPQASEAALIEATLQGVRAGSRDLELRLLAGVFIEGEVTGPDGEAVAHAWLMGMSTAQQRDAEWFPAQLDGEKRFKLGPLLPGRYRLSAHGSGEYLSADPVEVVAPAERVRILLKRVLTLRGTLVGTPAPERFSVSFTHMAPDGPSTVRGKVLASGEFLVTVAQDEVGTLYFQDDDRGDQYGLVPGARPSPTALTVTLKTGLTIQGRIDPYAEGDQGFVYLQSSSGLGLGAKVAKDGSFIARGVPPGEYDITTISAGVQLAPIKNVPAGTQNVLVRSQTPSSR